METLIDTVERSFSKQTYKCVVSNPVTKQEKYRKIEFNFLNGFYYIAKYTNTQVFHEKKTYEEAKAYILSILGTEYKNLNAWNADCEFIVQISKKGKILFKTKETMPENTPEVKQEHNREKNYILPQGKGIEPLIDMGIMTRDGKIVKTMYSKYRQINRFVEIIDDEVKNIEQKELNIIDFGCGKSYLTFILYYYFTELKGIKVNMTGLDLKQDVIEKCNAAAQKYGYRNLRFKVGDISSYVQGGPVDIVITLHACDTATDYALHNAVRWNADLIFSVPCCQHELNRQIESDHFKILTRYGIVKERFASLATDAIRCNLLACCGYRTQMVEFVAFDHTPKNIMIRAVKKGRVGNRERLEEVEALMREFNLRPTLYQLLKDTHHI